MNQTLVLRATAFVAVLSLASSAPLPARQAPAPAGRLALELTVGTSSFSGGAGGQGESGETLSFTPHRPTMVGLAASWGRESLRFEGAARYGEPGLALRGVPQAGVDGTGQQLVLVAENAFHLGSFFAGVSARLGRLRGGPTLRASLAFTLERWSAPDTPTRSIAGGQAGLAMEVALTGSLTARLTGEVGLTPASPFRAEELPEGFEPERTWRRSLNVGVAWRP